MDSSMRTNSKRFPMESCNFPRDPEGSIAALTSGHALPETIPPRCTMVAACCGSALSQGSTYRADTYREQISRGRTLPIW